MDGTEMNGQKAATRACTQSPAPSHVNSPRNILVAVTGMSPQIVTETLFALTVVNESPWVPDEIHLITTGQGAKQAALNLLSSEPGWFHRLRADYGLPEIAFDESRIHAIRDADGRVLNDIRTPQDNEAAADFITERIRELTRIDRSAVHASIAGGRKTMGFFLGYAMSLYGRPQDKLSHVLISEPFEGLPGFYYPTPYQSVIQPRDNKTATLDAQDARVTLADIPFVRLREGLPQHLLDGRASFSASVAAAQRALLPPQIRLDVANGTLQAGGTPVEIGPADLAFYLMLARRAKQGETPLRHTDADLAGRYLADYARLVGKHSGPMQHAEQRLAEGELKNWFDERMSKCKRAIERALDGPLARPYLIQTYGGRPTTRYGLAIAPENIHIVEDERA